jgi:glutathione S-transferase
MKLYWSSRSPYVRKVMVCAHERGLADSIECVRVVVALSQANPIVMRSNPLGKIPTLTLDDGRILYDSALICEYLDSLGSGPALFPVQGEQRWVALKRHALGNGMLDTLILWRAELAKPQTRQTPEWLATFALKIRNALDVIEADAEQLMQAQFDIGHVAIAVALAYLDFRFAHLDWRNGHPRAAACSEQFGQRDSMQKTRFIDA